ncbi:hypothetical protein EDD36DRAFT_63643 [Exophiala viscosa]|uniref:Uncharacterized protein n=1 Tax=Exophiala viscosa TaxID=2486360 RepID=A0AAN6IAE2_9EURO|nr:hypothetical protein EDD36DRAFT_63643 [Exophiala viscosa]
MMIALHTDTTNPIVVIPNLITADDVMTKTETGSPIDVVIEVRIHIVHMSLATMDGATAMKVTVPMVAMVVHHHDSLTFMSISAEASMSLIDLVAQDHPGIHLSILAAMVVHGKQDIPAMTHLDIDEKVSHLAADGVTMDTTTNDPVTRMMAAMGVKRMARDVKARHTVFADKLMCMVRVQTKFQVGIAMVKMRRMPTDDQAKQVSMVIVRTSTAQAQWSADMTADSPNLVVQADGSRPSKVKGMVRRTRAKSMAGDELARLVVMARVMAGMSRGIEAT